MLRILGMPAILPYVILCPVDNGVMLIQSDKFRCIDANIDKLFNFPTLSELLGIGIVVGGPGFNIGEHIILQINEAIVLVAIGVADIWT